MTETFQQLSQSIAGTVEAAGHALVTVHARRRRPASGLVYSADGLIVTANHVVERDDNLIVNTADGTEHSAELVGRDPALDIALLRIPTQNLAPANWHTGQDLRVGELVLAVARPNGGIQVSLGALSSVGGPWQHRAGGRFDLYLQADVTMYPGFSGGGLLTAAGTFAGLTSSALAHGATLAVPASTVRKSVDALLAHGHIPRAYLGVGVQRVQVQAGAIPQREDATALMIMSVENDTPAQQSGLLQGDILYALHGQSLARVEDLQSLLAEITEPTTVSAQILRGGTPQELTVQLTVR